MIRIAIVLLLAFPATGFGRSAVILLPGYLGSGLRDKQTKKEIYMNLARVALNPCVLALNQESLGAPVGREAEFDDILRYVQVIPGLYKRDVYGSMIDRLSTLPESEVEVLGYDWRMDPYDAVLKLGEAVERLRANGVTQIHIVAHSLGGLIAAYYLAYGTQPPETAQLDWSGSRYIEKLVLLGVPFRGAFFMLKIILRGIDLPLINRLFPAGATATYPSNYFALPLDAVRVYDYGGKPWKLPIFDLDFWQRWNLGLMADDVPKIVRDNRVVFLRTQLHKAQQFMKLLQFSENSNFQINPATRILSFTGYGTRTSDSAYFSTSKDTIEFLFDSDRPSHQGLTALRLFSDGDGSVTLDSARLPGPLQAIANSRFVEINHVRLSTDRRLQNQIVDFLQ